MGGSSIAYGGGRATSPVKKSSEPLQLQQRGNYNDDLAGRCLPAQHVNRNPITLFRDWLVGFDPISSQLFRPTRFFSHSSEYGKHLQCERNSISYLHDKSHKKAVRSLYQVGVPSKHAQNEDERNT